MPTLPQACHTLLMTAGLAASVAGVVHAQEAAPLTDPSDAYAWLEGVENPKALDWVRSENAKTEAELAATPEFKKLEGEIRAILDSDAKIPGVEKIGDYYYNFWKDAKHERGLWRRTTLDEYRKARPQWETVIDLDALNEAEKIPDGKKWVWHAPIASSPSTSAA